MTNTDCTPNHQCLIKLVGIIADSIGYQVVERKSDCELENEVALLTALTDSELHSQMKYTQTVLQVQSGKWVELVRLTNLPHGTQNDLLDEKRSPGLKKLSLRIQAINTILKQRQQTALDRSLYQKFAEWCNSSECLKTIAERVGNL